MRYSPPIIGALGLLGCTLSSQEDLRARMEGATADGLIGQSTLSVAWDGPAPSPIGGSDARLRCGGATGPLGVVGTSPIYPTSGTVVDRVLSSALYDDERFSHQAFTSGRVHDMCYVHGRGAYGLSASDCDAEITARNRLICASSMKHNLAPVAFGATRLDTDFDGPLDLDRMIPATISNGACQARASIVDTLLGVGGPLAQLGNPNTNCPYGRGFMPVRDVNLIAGRFLGAAESLLQIQPDAGGALRFRISDPATGLGRLEGRVALGDVPLFGLPAEGASDPVYPCRAGPRCTLSDLAVAARDFLSFQPMALDLAGNGTEALLLVAFHDRVGPIAMTVRFGPDGAHPSPAFAIGIGEHGTAPMRIGAGHGAMSWPMEPIVLARERLAWDGRALRVPGGRNLPAVRGESVLIVAETKEGLTVRAFGFEIDPVTGGAIAVQARRALVTDDRPRAQRCDGIGSDCKNWEDAQIFSRHHYEPVPYLDNGDVRLALFHRPRPETSIKGLFDAELRRSRPDPFHDMSLRRWPSALFDALRPLPGRRPRAWLEGSDVLSRQPIPLEMYPWHFVDDGGFRDGDRPVAPQRGQRLSMVAVMLANTEGAERGPAVSVDRQRAQHIELRDLDVAMAFLGGATDRTPKAERTLLLPPLEWQTGTDHAGTDAKILHTYFWVAPAYGAVGPAGEPGLILMRSNSLGCTEDRPHCNRIGAGRFDVLWLWRDRASALWQQRALVCRSHGAAIGGKTGARSVLPVVVKGTAVQVDTVVYARRKGASVDTLAVYPQGGTLVTRRGVPGHGGEATPCQDHPWQWRLQRGT